LLHTEPRCEFSDWLQFPRVRETLAAWKMLAPDATQSAVARELGVTVDKNLIASKDPIRGIAAFVEQYLCDLLVLMTHVQSGPQRWLRGSIAEAAAHQAANMAATYRTKTRTLFVREDQKGFVDGETGAISLNTILFPIDGVLPHEDAISWIEAFTQLLAPGARIHRIHVGSGTLVHAQASDAGLDLHNGPVVDTICAVALEIGADMIAMPTARRHGVSDALLGSVTERVLHEAHCPVLAIPST